MSKLRRLSGLILIIFLFSLNISAQTTDLPRLSKNESYQGVRVKLLKAGWKPYHAKDADVCQSGDKRCENRPEMEACAGTGLAACRFLWKRGRKTVVIFTVGEENALYNGYKYQ